VEHTWWQKQWQEGMELLDSWHESVTIVEVASNVDAKFVVLAADDS